MDLRNLTRRFRRRPDEWSQAFAAWQESRDTPHRDSACNAPFTNMYFCVDGQVAPCWLYYPIRPPRWGPDRSLLDIWRGPEFSKVRDALADGRFIGRCGTCEHDIATGNRPLAAAYDNEHPIGDWPTMLELELSNLCNLACIMCSDRLSSRIRRESGLPPLESPYDDSFVDQVAEVLPHLQELRFNGGEPLMQPLVHKIAERVAEIRPDLKVTIATNGTIINDKARRMMERCNVHVNISIDSLIPERYAKIRVHGDLDEVLANFDEYRRYCQVGERSLCVMVNPMRVNWDEMAEYVRWTVDRGVFLWFNTIRYPEHLALHNLPAGELAHIQETLAAEPSARTGRRTRRRRVSWQPRGVRALRQRSARDLARRGEGGSDAGDGGTRRDRAQARLSGPTDGQSP